MITLYKKDSKGKLRVLKMYVENADLVQQSGLADGKLTEARKTLKGKNIGKRNETSPEEQASLALDSKIAEKLKTDYFETENEAMSTSVVLPMLAKVYKEEAYRIDWSEGVYAQPKFDGMRCFAIVKDGQVQLISRENTDIIVQHKNSVGHLIPELAKLADGIYDGELYAHGYSFEDNMKLIKKYRPGASELVKLHCYDFVSDEPYFFRRDKVIKAAKITDAVQLVETIKITRESELMMLHAKWLSEGYEGSIVRYGTKGYELNHRSNYLLKLKDFMDVAAKVIDVIPMDNRPLQGKLVCTAPEFSGSFTANLKFSHKVRENILKNKKDYIGQTAEIRFFEYTDAGLPRFPVCVGFRLDK